MEKQKTTSTLDQPGLEKRALTPLFDYPGSLKALYNLSYFSARKGLKRIETIYKTLCPAPPKCAIVHIAGTNGKGSVAAKVASGLQLDGKKVGLFTSPHISSYRERIRISGELISEEAFCRHLQRIIEAADHYPTYFEALTLIALLHFEEEGVEYAVIETGLGGRQDPTNFLTPALTIITSISLDHTGNLGTTLDEIAIEKGGIIKEGVPVILGARAQLKPLLEIAKQKNAPTIFGIMSDGFFDDENIEIASLALKHLGVSDNAICRASLAKPRCRFEIFPQSALPPYPNLPEYVVLDVAHNPDGLEHLYRALSLKLPSLPIRTVFALGKLKDHAACIDIIKKHSAHIHPLSVANEKVASHALLEPHLPPHTRLTSLQEAFHPGEILLFCGTFYCMSGVRQFLNLNEPTDPDILAPFTKKLLF